MSMALIQRIHAFEMEVSALPSSKKSGDKKDGGDGKEVKIAINPLNGGGDEGEDRVATPQTHSAPLPGALEDDNSQREPTSIRSSSTVREQPMRGSRPTLLPPIPVGLIAAKNYLSNLVRGLTGSLESARGAQEGRNDDAGAVADESEDNNTNEEELDENIQVWSWRRLDRFLRHISAALIALVALALTSGILLLREANVGVVVAASLFVGLSVWGLMYLRIYCHHRSLREMRIRDLASSNLESD